jgi:hypothetical protein
MRVFYVLALFLVLFPGMAQAEGADVIEVRANSSMTTPMSSTSQYSTLMKA